MAASHFLDYYYRPLIFPAEYFKHYKESFKHRAVAHMLPDLYKEFKHIFVSELANTNSYNTYKLLLAEPTREHAEAFFTDAYHFFDYALSLNTEFVKMRMRATVPFSNRLIAIYEQGTSRDIAAQSAKVRAFLHMLFLDTYKTWILSLQGVKENAVPNR